MVNNRNQIAAHDRKGAHKIFVALVVKDIVNTAPSPNSFMTAMGHMGISYVLIAKYRFIRIVHVQGNTLGVFFVICVTLL